VAALTSTAFAGFQAPLPEFKNEKQLVEWRAEKASEATSQGYASEETAFYTGKPYVESSGGYAFKYRNYNPELARWTSEDPSGFPDGANGSIYAPTPTSDLDVAGLLKWSTLKDTGLGGTKDGITWELWTVQTNDGQSVINLSKYVSGGGPGVNYTYNCHGYTFGNSQYWINGQVDVIIKGDGYKLITGNDKSKAKIASWGGDVHTAKVNKVSDGGSAVTEVTGKKGAEPTTLTSTPAGQGYSGEIKYYE
jgi:RHS repeat-associated protein